MEAAKTFERNGVRYRAGDALPADIDKPTLEHYKRYGMVREAKPTETKPVGQRRRSAPEHRQTKPAGPAHTTAPDQQSAIPLAGALGNDQAVQDDQPPADLPPADTADQPPTEGSEPSGPGDTQPEA